MYYIEKITYFIEEAAIPTYIAAEERIWDTWLIQQPGVVRKELWLDPDQPNILKVVVTWFSMDFANACDQNEIARLEGQMDEALAGYTCVKMSTDCYFSKTCIENNMIDNDEDQDDDGATDSKDYVPKDDQPAMVGLLDMV